MRSSKRLVFRLMLPLLLAIVLVVGGSDWVNAHSGRIDVSVGVDLQSVSEQLDFVDTKLVRRQRIKKVSSEKINYDLIVKDIIQLFKWLDSPEINSQQLAARISGNECDDECPIKLSGERTFHDGLLVFHEMNSEKYIGEIAIYPYNKTDKRVGLEIHLREAYKSKFSLTDFIARLASQADKPIRNPTAVECDGGDDYDCPQWFLYITDIKTKFFPSSKSLNYRVRTDFYRYKRQPEQLQGISLNLSRS
jgi:hypothetical protein